MEVIENLPEKVIPEKITQQISVEVFQFETERPMRVDDGEGEADIKNLVKTPYSSGLDRLRETFIRNTRKLIFRTVEEVKISEQNYLGTVFLRPQADGSIVSEIFKPGDHLPAFSQKDRERCVESHYKKFFCFTKETALRPNSLGEVNIKGSRVFLDSKNYNQLDFFDNMDFKFSKRPEDRKNTVIPVKGDIVCILPIPGRNGCGPEAKFWFICSPQFLRTWTLIHYREHDAIRSIAEEESTLRKKIFSGNCTMTNGYLGWTVSCFQNGLTSDESELEKRFWNLRTEFASREYVHVYSALVMMLRYGECPGPNNIPNKLDSSPPFLSWHIPDGWLHRLFEEYELKVLPDPAIRFLEVLVRDQNFIPKGTRYLSPPIAVLVEGVTNHINLENIPESIGVPEELNATEDGGECTWGDLVVEDN